MGFFKKKLSAASFASESVKVLTSNATHDAISRYLKMNAVSNFEKEIFKFELMILEALVRLFAIVSVFGNHEIFKNIENAFFQSLFDKSHEIFGISREELKPLFCERVDKYEDAWMSFNPHNVGILFSKYVGHSGETNTILAGTIWFVGIMNAHVDGFRKIDNEYKFVP